MRPPAGSRVRLVHDVERYPHFVAPAGALGTVVELGDPGIVFAVRLDEPLAGAEDWRNEVHWLDGDAELNGLDVDELVAQYVELVEGAAGPPTSADFVNLDALQDASDDELRGIIRDGGPAALIVAARRELEARDVTAAHAGEPLTGDEREQLAGALADYAENVQENLADDRMRDHELELDGEPNDDGVFPVVEDYLADADRIRAGESPLHAHTLEVLADTTGPAALVDEPAAFLALVGRLEAPARPLLDTSNPLEASIARARDEDAEQDAAYERASADVVLPLSRDDAVAIADALETLADLDEGEHLDDDELRRLARLVRAYIPPAPVPAVDAVTLVAKALAELGVPVHLVRDDVLVDTAARALEAAGVGPGSVPEGRAFVADVLRDKRDELELVDPYTLGRWLVDELTAE